MLRHILTYNLVVLLLLTNIGIPVYTHICHTQAKSWSSFYVPAKSCCSKKSKTPGMLVCHVPKAGADSSFKSLPCCENQSGLIKSEVTYTPSQVGWLNFSLIVLTPVVLPVDNLYPLSFAIGSTSILKTHGPAYTIYGRSLLISQQVFRC